MKDKRLLVVDVGNTSTAVGTWTDGRVSRVAHVDGGFEEAAAAADTGFVGAHHDELITYLKSTVSGILMAGGIMGE